MSEGNALVLSELGLLRGLVERIASKLEIDTERGPFDDINPVKLYTVRELVQLRGGVPQVLYRALKSGELKCTPTNSGTKQIRGSDYIAYLQQKTQAKA